MKKVISDTILGAFGKFPHDVYVSYDELTDELLIRLIDPARPAYVCELKENDNYAYLVEADSDVIIGLDLYNFQRDHLPQASFSNMRKGWSAIKDFYAREGYKKLRYIPEQREKEKNDDALMRSVQLELQKVLA